MRTDIQARNEILKKEIDELKKKREMYDRKAEYQSTLTRSFRNINTYLLFFYYFMFIVVKVALVQQYFQGIPRNEWTDGIVLTLIFIYPAVIFYIESYIYFAIQYVASFIYRNTYVYTFDRAMINTNFYGEPKATEPDNGLPSITVNIT